MIDKIIKKIKEKLRSILLLKRDYLEINYYKSYSQEGEDMVLRELFRDIDKGFYVDIGAHHPKRYSNTYYFYNKGWNGINIDAMPGSMKLFNFFRPRDINIEAAVSDQEGKGKYYIYNEGAINGFAHDNINYGDYHVKKIDDISFIKLAKIFEDNDILQNQISFMSIDVEGLELSVLQSNDWDKYRPNIILVENSIDILDIDNNDVHLFLKSNNYSIVAKTTRNYFYRDSKLAVE